MFLEAKKKFFHQNCTSVLLYYCTFGKTAGKISAACGQDYLIIHFLFVAVVVLSVVSFLV